MVMVGTLLNLSRFTGYDIFCAARQLTRVTSDPVKAAQARPIRLLRYLYGKPDFRLHFNSGKLELHGRSDATYASDPENRKYMSGYRF